MSRPARTIYVSERVWRRINPYVRADLINALGSKSAIVKRYACNVESDLRARGQHALANRFLTEILPEPEDC